MVVMALLRQSHLVFKTEHLGAVLAERAVHRRFSTDHFLHPLHKGVEHQGVIPQILSRHEIHLRMISGHQLGVLTDPAHQHSREEEVRKDHDALEAKAHHMPQTRFHQRKRHPGVHRFTPAKSKPLHQHPGHLGHIGVGVGI